MFFWLIQIPLAGLLALHLDLQATGVFWAVFVSETSVGVFTLWLFSRGEVEDGERVRGLVRA